MPEPISATIGAGVLGAGASIYSANKASKTQQQASNQASDTQLQMFREANRLNEPWRQAGMGALTQQQALLGIGGGQPTAQQGGGFGNLGFSGGDQSGSSFGSYVMTNPDLARAWSSNQGNIQNQFRSIEDFGRFHFQNFGQTEGRQLPQSGVYMGGGRDLTGIPGADPFALQKSAGDSAYQNFLDSGFARSMLQTTENDMNMYRGAMGAAGTSISGSAIKGLNDINRRNTSTAFNNHFGALSGLSGTGAQLSQSQGQQGIQTGQIMGNNLLAGANARASGYQQIGNSVGQFGNLLAYGSGNGWFGGGGSGGGGHTGGTNPYQWRN